MKLQLALDTLTTEHALWIARRAREYVDILEIGTPLIKHEGVAVVRALRQEFPEKELLADLKTMDAGEYEAGFCFEAGADLVTVLGVADLRTIEGAVRSARSQNRRVAVDLMSVPDKAARARDAEAAGANLVAVHSGIDQQRGGHNPLADLDSVMHAVRLPVMVAGGIDLTTVDAVVERGPAVVVVGAAVTSSDEPGDIARRIRARMP